jgi:threonine aldolase
MTDQDEAQRRWVIARGCHRRLSGLHPQTMAERLRQLAAIAPEDERGDTYGDAIVGRLEQRIADLLGQDAAAFFPTGTMAQQVALRIWAARTANPTVALHPLAHPELHERHALSTLTGLRTVWPTTERRPLTAADVRDLGEAFGTLMVELPLRDPGFLLPTWDELVAVVAAARARGARVHFDGARLWETTPYFGRTLAQIAALADTTYVSFYKSMGGLAGAALVGPGYFIAEARAWRHRYGGNVFQQYPAVLSAWSGLDTILPALPDYVRHARRVAEALSELPGAIVHPLPPHTHQFQLWLPYPAERLNQACLALAESRGVWFAGDWSDQPPTGLARTEITVAGPALELDEDEVRDLAAAFLAQVPD